jgi:hypothetical protein
LPLSGMSPDCSTRVSGLSSVRSVRGVSGLHPHESTGATFQLSCHLKELRYNQDAWLLLPNANEAAWNCIRFSWSCPSVLGAGAGKERAGRRAERRARHTCVGRP